MKPISKFHLVVIMDEQLCVHDVYVEFLMEMCNIHTYIQILYEILLTCHHRKFLFNLALKNIVLLQC